MEMVTVARHLNATAADIAAARLAAAGFAVLRHDEFSAYPAAIGGILLQVPADQAGDARVLLASVEVGGPEAQ